MSRAIVWFRNDLRIEDNPAWSDATSTHDEVIPVVVLDSRLLASAGPFRRSQWLANVAALSAEFDSLGGSLTLLEGDPAKAFAMFRGQADRIVVNSPTTEWGRGRDEITFAALGIDHTAHWGTLVAPPRSVLTGKGTVSRVFTPFFKKWKDTALEPWPEPGPATIVAAKGVVQATIPAHDEPPFPPGTAGAHEQLDRWLDDVDNYRETNDLPAIEGTSRLSAALRHGTISPRTVLDFVGTSTPGREAFIRQLAWRDWYAHLLIDRPEMLTSAVKPEYDRINWRDDPESLQAWKDGRTGFPIVDAGMRQLAETGWMHNRVRMIVASFLVKDLLIDWRRGERWFRWLLADGEPSQNAGNWQ